MFGIARLRTVLRRGSSGSLKASELEMEVTSESTDDIFSTDFTNKDCIFLSELDYLIISTIISVNVLNVSG